MTKFVLLACFLIAMILTSFAKTPANDPPARFPATLLSLYRQSDVIIVGRYDKKEDFGTNRVGSGFAAVTTRTHFDVSSVLKGEPRRFVVVENEEFRYQIAPRAAGEAPTDAVFVEDIGSFDPSKQPKPGDTVLVFLKREGDSLELVNDRDGVRKIAPADENDISERLKELDSILTGRKADATALTDWLVRCAEQQATRWDGTHELISDGQVLSSDQKSALTQIVLGPGFVAGDLSAADRELIALVKRWDAALVARCLIEHLQSGAFSRHQNATMMSIVVQMLGDSDQAETLAGRYSELSAPGNDDSSESSLAIDARRSLALNSFVSLVDRLLANRPTE